MATRRSTRKFSTNPVERWKIDKVLAADSAPTAGNFQGFEIFYISDKETKEELSQSSKQTTLCQYTTSSGILHESSQGET